MTSAQRAQTFALNSKIANSITEAESKDRKRNSNENEQLLRQRNDELNPQRVRPRARYMLVNPLRAADQVKRQRDDICDKHNQFGRSRLNGNRERNSMASCNPSDERQHNSEDDEHNDGISDFKILVAQKDREGAAIKE